MLLTPALTLLLCGVLLIGAASASAAPGSAGPRQGTPQGLLPLLALQQAQLTAGDGAVADYFGYSVALSGDTALVGAFGSDVGANTGQGSAYVFVRTGANWTFQQKLTAGDGASLDDFGWSVALAGDTALIGAYWDDVGANTDQGSAYVFVRSGAHWTFQQKLTAGDGAAGDRFGSSVALAGDTALVGASTDTFGPFTDQGSAYVFVRSGAVWAQQQKLFAGDGASLDNFGFSCALAGDTALVGAYWDDIGANANQGSAYVFTRSGATWTFQQKLTAVDGVANDDFGGSVALSGETALIGTGYDDVGANVDQGSAYVFVRSGASWAFQQQLTAGDGAATDRFGTSVALAGDTAVVGAPYDDVGANADQGSACLFTRSGTSWTQQDQLTAGDGAATDRFGTSVDLDGVTALSGAFMKSMGGNIKQGSAYAFLLDGVAPVTTVAFARPANAAGWYRTAVTVVLTATDQASGVASSEYRLAGAASWTPYAAPFAIATQGASTWEYRSIDRAGNVEIPKTFSVKLDSRRPSTKAYAATVKQGKKVKLGYKVNDPAPGCGSAKATIKIYKGKKLKKTLGAVACATNVKKTRRWKATLPTGTYTIKVYAKDIAGNAQSKVGSAKLTIK